MDKREALFHVFSIVCKCDTANDCKNCLYYGDKENPCLVQFALDAGASHDKAALQRIAELWEEAVDKDKDNKQTYVPLENVGSIIIKKPSKRSAEEKFENEQESFASGDNLSPVESKPIDRDIFIRPNDRIKHPSHYFKGGMECIDAIRAAVTDCRGFEAYCVGNIVKYVWRYKEKNGIEDLQKAAKYLEWLQEEVKENETRR